jgi:hypothetical protein
VVGIVETIRDCLKNQRIVSALILLYSGIEIVARMGSKPSEATRDYFVRWVDSYVLKHHKFEATALDLYAARCGVVHALSSDSDLYRAGKARRIIYSWGNADRIKLKKAAAALSHDAATVHIDELVGAFMLGIADFMEELDKNSAAKQRAEQVRMEWFADLDPSVLENFIALQDASSLE